MHDLMAGYGKAQVLHGVSVTVEPGEIVALVGPNGAGKTTTIRCITGEVHPTGGSLTYGGVDLSSRHMHQVVNLGISCSPEGRNIFGNLSVYENLKMGGYILKGKATVEDKIDWVYQLFPRLGERRHQRAESLSGGEQQMLAIGRAIMSQPSLLLLDEPSLGLAPVIVDQIYEKILAIRREGTSILLVEQNVGLALDVSQRAYVIESGQIKVTGPSCELVQNPYVVDTYLGVK